MDLEKLEQIKRLAIISAFSDDTLMDILVLKGGNALDIVYQSASRASIDLDFSIESELESTVDFLNRLESSFKKVFGEKGYEVFDMTITEKPKKDNSNMPKYWGGYQLEFKIIDKDDYAKLQENKEDLRRNAAVIGPNQQKKFTIDISKWEYCSNKTSYEIDGYTIYVYSLEMIVLEKIRAICQQMPEYTKSIGRSYQTARARDFFDIYTVFKKFTIDLTTPENIELVKLIFKQKGVCLSSIQEIKNYREYHRSDFSAVQDTVKSQGKLKNFDFYFDYVVTKCDELYQALGEV